MQNCCEKKGSNPTLLNSMLSSLKCNCDDFNKDTPLIEDDEISFEKNQCDPHTATIFQLLDKYFKKMNTEVFKGELMLPTKEAPQMCEEKLRAETQKGKLLTESEKTFIYHALQKRMKMIQVIHELLFSIQEHLRPDFFFLVTVIIEEYISTPRLSNHLNKNVQKIKTHFCGKMHILASSLKNLLPEVP